MPCPLLIQIGSRLITARLKPLFLIFAIAGIYIFRGLGELIFDMTMQEASPLAETTYSLIALAIGLIFLIGGLKKWNSNSYE